MSLRCYLCLSTVIQRADRAAVNALVIYSSIAAKLLGAIRAAQASSHLCRGNYNWSALGISVPPLEQDGKTRRLQAIWRNPLNGVLHCSGKCQSNLRGSGKLILPRSYALETNWARSEGLSSLDHLREQVR